jgi:RimJ/RimL family protein N-acetyltransferase
MVVLKKMSAEDYEHYLSYAIEDFANEKIKAGTWSQEEGLTLAKQAFDGYLPRGVDTPHEHLYCIVSNETNEKIGYFWFHYDEADQMKSAFVYDFLIFESFQGQGYGTQTMQSFETLAKEMGIKKLGLHVFAHNKRAWHLYEKMGFHATDVTMAKYI